MIVVASKPGRLGNLLIVYASLLAWAFEHNKKILNPSFHAYIKYFKRTGRTMAVIRSAGYKISYYTARITDKFRISNPIFGTRHLDWSEKIDLEREALPSVPLYFLQG